MEELSTIRDFIRLGMSMFNQAEVYFGHGTDNAWDEAVNLITYILHLTPDVTQDVLDSRLMQHEKEQLLEIFNRRISERIPAAYLTNKAWFAGLEFYVDERVIIPRSPIAELILQGFAPWVNQVSNVLDLCTGSGAIAIACAKAFPEAHIDAIDNSKQALELANINVERHDLNEQVKLYQADLFSNLPDTKYDLILSNPPYVSAEELANLPKEYRHEPETAFAAGIEGLDFVLKILEQAHAYLLDTGILIVEVGSAKQALIEKLPHVPFLWLEFAHGGEGVFLLTKEQLQTI